LQIRTVRIEPLLADEGLALAFQQLEALKNLLNQWT